MWGGVVVVARLHGSMFAWLYGIVVWLYGLLVNMKGLKCMFYSAIAVAGPGFWFGLVGFLTSSSTIRLYRGRAPKTERLTILRAVTHETELGGLVLMQLLLMVIMMKIRMMLMKMMMMMMVTMMMSIIMMLMMMITMMMIMMFMNKMIIKVLPLLMLIKYFYFCDGILIGLSKVQLLRFSSW